MEKIKCFEIEEKSLYLDQVLVELNFPILFVCKDNYKGYYMAMCTDAGKLTYLVQKCTPTVISDMILGKITMRNFWLGAVQCWRISTGDEPVQDSVSRVTADLLAESELPDDENYIVDDDIIKEYAASLSGNQSYALQFPIHYFNYGIDLEDDYIEDDAIREQRKQLMKDNKSTISIKNKKIKCKKNNFRWESLVCLTDQPVA